MALGWSPSRTAEDGDESVRVETELHANLIHNPLWRMCCCLSLRRIVILGPKTVGDRVKDLQGVCPRNQERKLDWPQCYCRRVVIDLTKPMEQLVDEVPFPRPLEKKM